MIFGPKRNQNNADVARQDEARGAHDETSGCDDLGGERVALEQPARGSKIHCLLLKHFIKLIYVMC